MHDIEPHYGWREQYIASEDKESPFYGRNYSEFSFSQKVYNYYIHPQWDEFGSSTLYMKILFVDYDEHYAIIELIGEWNDCIHNDVMFLKRNIVDSLIDKGISKFIVICENVLNFHGSDDSYYEEWWEEVNDENGWIVFLNSLDHVLYEMEAIKLQFYVKLGIHYNFMEWRKSKPFNLFLRVSELIATESKQLYY